jgi:LysM repeat protein
MKMYLTKKGDTLQDIAQKHQIAWDDIISMNPHALTTEPLASGTKIILTKTSETCVHESPQLHNTYVVQQGDSLWKLSKKWDISLQTLIDLNPQLKNPNVLLTNEIVYFPNYIQPSDLEKNNQGIETKNEGGSIFNIDPQVKINVSHISEPYGKPLPSNNDIGILPNSTMSTTMQFPMFTPLNYPTYDSTHYSTSTSSMNIPVMASPSTLTSTFKSVFDGNYNCMCTCTPMSSFNDTYIDPKMMLNYTSFYDQAYQQTKPMIELDIPYSGLFQPYLNISESAIPSSSLSDELPITSEPISYPDTFIPPLLPKSDLIQEHSCAGKHDEKFEKAEVSHHDLKKGKANEIIKKQSNKKGKWKQKQEHHQVPWIKG